MQHSDLRRIVVDCRVIEENPEEEIEILGPNAPPHTFAWKAGKAPEEFVVCLSPDIPREFCGGPPMKSKR